MTLRNKIQNFKKKSIKRNGLKINNTILKWIKKYPKVTHHRENRFEWRMVHNSTRIRGRRDNISKSYYVWLPFKSNPNLKEVKKSAYDWNNIKKDIREFYFKCPTCEIRTSKPRKKLWNKAYRIRLSQAKIPSWYSVFGWLHCKWCKIFIYDCWSFQKVWVVNFNEK